MVTGNENAADEKVGKRASGRAHLVLVCVALVVALLWWWSPEGLYDWAKVVHIVSVISWMAGLLYLPRLFVYHADAEVGSDTSELFKTMERRLLKVIMGPAMVGSWVFGLWLAWQGFVFAGVWLWMKIILVLAMTFFHAYLSKAQKAFEADQNIVPSRTWRFLNEIPTVLMILIVVFVVVKPFN